ncbi:MAG TPA: M1 family metallopeptidase [Pyrinomonadaceae bacterium]|nr:M1 family metallopeptidase [Pyrinomonadaceae bacterium]
MRRKLTVIACLVALLVCPGAPRAQRELGARPTDSGGPLMPEQAAYDVTSYDLSLRIDPREQAIAGTLTARARIVHPTEWFVLDLDTPLAVSKTSLVSKGSAAPLSFERRGGKVWIAFPVTKQPGEAVEVRVEYGGKPRVAPRPPWVGGFVWSKTPAGQDWISTAVQMDGADLFWPCKDHPSDEPDEMTLHITVPSGLVVATNGKLTGVVKNNDDTSTYNWHVSTPINNYGVALNIAPYRTIEGEYRSVSGERVPAAFWVLPENYEKGQKLFAELFEMLAFLEKHLGPFPFRADKIGVAETSHLGMEHQTIIAYGNRYEPSEIGFDWLLFHELGHEWWANLVTASDWRDFWLHEGFQSYMDALYRGEKRGPAAYHQHIAALRHNLNNRQPLAPREARTTVQMYFVAPDYLNSDGDVYNKGAAVLHTLRYLVGDKAFFTALRRMAYPTEQLERVTDGRQCRFASTEDFRHIAEEASGMKLDWFFEVYARQAELPRLVSEVKGDTLTLRWEAPAGLAFPMPVTVRLGERTQKIEVSNAPVSVPLGGQQPVVDPENWLLMKKG